MAEKVGSIYFDLDLDDAKYQGKMNAADSTSKSFGKTLQENSLQLAALGAAAGLALNTVINKLETAVDAAVKQQNALMGLSSVAKGTGNSMDAATDAAKRLSADGLMPIGDAAAGLKNLLGAGFSLPEAIQLMNRFKDAAAFGRQGSLEFGQAIVGATEGIKNGNSALVDNAGVTKNLSNMLVDAGYSAQDLAKAGDDVGVRMAIFNGIIKETKNQTGDAAKMAESFGGAQARMNTQITTANVLLGTALQPILTKVMDALSPLIQGFIDFAKNNPQLVAALVAATVAALAFLTIAGLIAGVIGAVAAAGIGGLVATFAAVAAAIGVVVGALIFAETKFGLVSKALDVLKTFFDRVKDAVVGLFDLFVRGDITGSFLRSINMQEDSPFIGMLWKMREALKAVYDFVSDQFSSVWQSLQSIWDQLAKAMQPVIDALGKVFSTIGKFLADHSEAILGFFKVIGIVLGAIALAPFAIAIGIVLGALKLLAVVLGFVAKHFDTIKKVVLVALAVVFSPLIIAIGAVVIAFKAIVWIVQTLWTVFTTVFNAIWAVVSFVFNGIMAVWNSVLSPVFNAIIFIIQSLFTIWWTIFTGILSVVTTVISTIAQIIFVVLSALFGWIYNNFLLPIGRFFGAIFNGIWQTIQFVFNAIVAGITWYLQTVWGIITSVFNAVVGFVSWAWNGIKNSIINPIAQAVSAVWQKITGIKDAVVDGVNSAWNWIKGKFNDFVNAGRDLINGLVNGISNAKDAVVNKVKEICSGALDSVKKFFGIKSPSRVMAQMGDYLMIGFRNGISAAGDAVVTAAQRVSESVAEGVNNGINQVQDGTKSIIGLYGGMYNNLNAMSAAGIAPLAGSMAAIISAGDANEANGGAIAQAPIAITVNPSGIIARSRADLRDIAGDMINAVNEDLVARGVDPIGNGKVNGTSNV